MRRDVRILSRIEKVGLALVAGFVFMGVASTAAPGLQSLVAGISCPSGTTATAVVRYPRVLEPTEMVRNTPLVCVVDGVAELAPHGRVLPALFLVGLVASSAVIVGVSTVVGLARRGGDTSVPARRRTTLERARYLPLLITTPFVFMTVYGLYWWLAVDTPYRVSGCRSSSGAGATCYDGEPVYRMQALGVGALVLIGLGIWAAAVVRSTRRNRRFAEVWSSGVRAPATLISAEPTNTKIGGSRVHRFTYEIRPADGSPPFTFEEKGVSSEAGGAIGSRVEAIYDPTDPGVAFIVPPGTPPPPHAPEPPAADAADPPAHVVTW